MDQGISISTLLYGTAGFLGILQVLILTWMGASKQYSNHLLRLFLLVFSLFAVQNMFQHTGSVLAYPFMYRIFKPMHYLIGPLFFLYIRAMLQPGSTFRRAHLLHGIPFLIHLIDFIPFYSMPLAQKRLLIEASLLNPETAYLNAVGFLPIAFHHIMVALSMTTYLSLTGRQIYMALRSASSMANRPENNVVRRWIVLFWCLLALFFIIWQAVFGLRGHLSNVHVFTVQTTLVAFFLLINGMALFFYPGILYGFQVAGSINQDAWQRPKPDPSEPEERSAEQGVMLTPERRKLYKETLETLVETEKPYLNPNLTLTDLASATQISYIYLSAVINHEYGMNFRDYINRYRVEHMKQLMVDPDASQYTLEAMAQMAGFGSRVTCSRAFQKFERCTPSACMKRYGIAG
jgi:AraC-like DNA-binding protein